MWLLICIQKYAINASHLKSVILVTTPLRGLHGLFDILCPHYVVDRKYLTVDMRLMLRSLLRIGHYLVQTTKHRLFCQHLHLTTHQWTSISYQSGLGLTPNIVFLWHLLTSKYIYGFATQSMQLGQGSMNISMTVSHKQQILLPSSNDNGSTGLNFNTCQPKQAPAH